MSVPSIIVGDSESVILFGGKEFNVNLTSGDFKRWEIQSECNEHYKKLMKFKAILKYMLNRNKFNDLDREKALEHIKYISNKTGWIPDRYEILIQERSYVLKLCHRLIQKF